MRDQNPMDSSVISKDKSFKTSANIVDQRIGFINRDAQVSESVPAPSVEYPLGNMYTSRLTRLDPITTENMFHNNDDGMVFPRWAAEVDWFAEAPALRSESIPGIITYAFDPIFGLGMINGSENLKQQSNQTDRFINYWSKLRLFNNQTRDVQPGDIQFYTAELMNIFMHVANLRRILNVFKSATMSSTSAYNSPEALATALGWPMKEFTMRTNITQWINIFNRDILGNLRNVVYFKDIVPGMNRWASLCADIYKDTSANTDYTQLAALVPAHAYEVHQTQNSQGVVVWSLLPYDESQGVLWKYGGAANPDTEYPNAFNRYLRWVINQIRSFFYDESSATIAALLNTVMQRSASTASALGITQLDLGADISHEPEEVPYVWDYKMMLALHNATIATNIANMGAYVRPSDGVLVQVIHQKSDIVNNNGAWLEYSPKVMNLPCFAPTNSDIANALQWCYVNNPAYQYAVTESGLTTIFDIDPLAYGTDVITSAWIYKFARSTVEGHENEIRYTATEYYQAQDIDGCLAADGTSQKDKLASMRDATAFAFTPIFYWIEKQQVTKTPAPYAVGTDIRIIRDFSTNDTEVIYSVDFNVLSEVHRAWQNNFWGYPIDLKSEGRPDLTGDSASSV